jgi:hypothetical protein
MSTKKNVMTVLKAENSQFSVQVSDLLQKVALRQFFLCDRLNLTELWIPNLSDPKLFACSDLDP